MEDSIKGDRTRNEDSNWKGDKWNQDQKVAVIQHTVVDANHYSMLNTKSTLRHEKHDKWIKRQLMGTLVRKAIKEISALS